MSKSMVKPRFKVDDTAFVVDRAEYVANNEVRRIPLGTEVKIRTVSVLKAKGYPTEVRYEVRFDGGPLVCWVDEDRLSPRVLDIAA